MGAGKNKKWGINYHTNGDVRVVLFVSRKKDNKDIDDYVERRKSFITDLDEHDERLKQKFEDFISKGVIDETSRMYISVNPRHMPTVKNHLLHFLIDDNEFNLCSIESKLAGIAAKKECAADRRWLIDFDSLNEKDVDEFINDLCEYVDITEIVKRRTPNGYAIITNRGFDSREIERKWFGTITIKKDDLLCVSWGVNQEEATCIITPGSLNNC